jgi:predicted lipoprotein with Yx(FWY)xxD motif
MKRFLPYAGMGLVLAVVGCGGGSKKTTSTPAASSTSTPATSTPASKGTAVDVRSSKLGRYLVDGTGRTVYLFEKDKGGKSACYGACAKVWTPLETKGSPSAGSGVAAGKLSTVKRTDGVTQVVYNGHPLYHYDDDHKPGQMEGEGSKEFGAEWYVLSPKGSKLEEEGS